MDTPYHTSQEYLEDCIKLMNIRIYGCLQNKFDNTLEGNYNGIFVSSQEVEAIFNTILGQNKISDDLIKLIEEKKISIENRAKLTMENNIYIPLMYLMVAFEMNEFEQHCFILSLMTNINKDYEKIFEYLQAEAGLKYPTMDIAIKLFSLEYIMDNPVKEILSSREKVFKFFLEKMQEYTSLLDIKLRLKESLVEYIFNNTLETKKSFYYKIFYCFDELEPFIYQNTIQQKLLNIINKQKDNQTVIYIYGEEGVGKKFCVKHIAKALNRNIVFVNTAKLYTEDINEYTDRVNTIGFEAIIQQAYICFYNFDCLTELSDKVFLDTLFQSCNCNAVFILMNKNWVYQNEYTYMDYHQLTMANSDREQRQLLWEYMLSKVNLDRDLDICGLANKFIFSAGQIVNAANKTIQDLETEQTDTVSKKMLYGNCYRQNTNMLREKATLIKPIFNWEDLILAQEYKSQIQQACNHISYKHIVYDQWNFDSKLAYGKGLSLLFEGPPGTGKTMAAQIVAADLDLELYKIDLSQIVSKYIGETEKNLSEIFNEASKSNVILFFDETDALFGKRSEVKEAQDKYANIETAYLLQKIEEYEGVVIMATNYLKNIDEAFIRRINYIIHFPFPNEQDRAKIWHEVFPKAMPVEYIDYEYLGKYFEISGGNIKSAALSAAFLAASEGENVGMKHLIKAIKHEITKQGKVILKEDFGEYSYLVE